MHARRQRRQPVTRDQAGAKKPHARPQIPRAEQIEQILRRRAASKVPDEERYRPKWLMALQMPDELAGWGRRPPLLVADAGYGQVAEFRQGLTERGIGYVVATTSSTTAQPGDAKPVEAAYAGVGKHPTPRYPTRPTASKTWPCSMAPTVHNPCAGVPGSPHTTATDPPAS